MYVKARQAKAAASKASHLQRTPTSAPHTEILADVVFDALDINSEGVISRREFQRAFEDGFKSHLSENERNAQLEMDELDADGDGVITDAEIRQKIAQDRNQQRRSSGGQAMLSPKKSPLSAHAHRGPNSKARRLADDSFYVNAAFAEEVDLGVVFPWRFARSSKEASPRHQHLGFSIASKQDKEVAESADDDDDFEVQQMEILKLLELCDCNGDGTISRSELLRASRTAGAQGSMVVGLFNLLDKNHDGTLSRDELEQGLMEETERKAVAAAHRRVRRLASTEGAVAGWQTQVEGFKRKPLNATWCEPEDMKLADALEHLDVNGDGLVSPKELWEGLARLPHHDRRRMQRLVDKMDSNQDGFISRREIEAAQRREQEHQEFIHAKRVRTIVDHVFDSLDTNGDGKVSRQELQRLFVSRGHRSHPAAKQMLAMLDLDGDSFISRAEIQHAVEEGDSVILSRLLIPSGDEALLELLPEQSSYHLVGERTPHTATLQPEFREHWPTEQQDSGFAYPRIDSRKW